MNLLLIVLLVLVRLLLLLLHAKHRQLLWLGVHHLHILCHLRVFTWFLRRLFLTHCVLLRESHANWTALLYQIVLLVRALAYVARVGRSAQLGRLELLVDLIV